jgi:hypothetical protein
MAEPRAIKKTIHNLNKYIIEPYNTDVFIVCQNFPGFDEKDLDLFDKNVKVKVLYDKKDPIEYFGKNCNASLPRDITNWNLPSCMQYYINEKELLNHIENYIDDYDYFIKIRTDCEILFPFPDKELFETVPHGIYTFDVDYSREWGGYSTGVFIHRDFIRKYLNKIWIVMKDTSLANKLHGINQETFSLFCFKKQNLKWSYIKNINLFFTAESVNSYTTWARIDLNPATGELYKYIGQYNEAYNNYRLWLAGKQWCYKNGIIILD